METQVTINKISDNIIELHFVDNTRVFNIKLNLFEEIVDTNTNKTTTNKTTVNFIYNAAQEQSSIPIKVENSNNNNIFIEITEINNNTVSYGLFNSKANDNVAIETIETIETIDNIKTIFGQQELSLNDSTLEEANKVFENFGQGLTKFNLQKLQINEHVNEQIKENEFNWQIKKKINRE